MGKAKMKGKRRSRALSDQQIDAILEDMMRGDLNLGEAEETLERLQAVRSRVVPKLVAMLQRLALGEPAGGQETPPRELTAGHRSDVLLVLLGYLGDAAIIAPLQSLVRDSSVADGLKLKVISLIYQTDPEGDVGELLAHLHDPHAAVRADLYEHLAHLTSPQDLALWLEMTEMRLPPDLRTMLVESVAGLDDASAVPLLICMCYDPDDDVALLAMDAVERFKDARALPGLEELANLHPRPQVRSAARKTADRLNIRASLVPQAQPSSPAPVYACYLTTMDGSGAQTAFVVRTLSDEALMLVAVAFNDLDGIEECFGAPVHMDQVDGLMQEWTEPGVSVVRVSHGQCLATLDVALEATLSSGRPLPMPYVAWRELIEGSRPAEGVDIGFSALAVPTERQAELLSRCHELLFQDEFEYWFIDVDELGDLAEQYLRLAEGKVSGIDEPALRQFLRQGVEQLMSAEFRGLVRARLQRVAPLLREIYEEDDVWQWAVVAAAALADDSPLPFQDHPLLLAMVAYSLENVLGAPIDWPAAI
jgi:hypothetical protein